MAFRARGAIEAARREARRRGHGFIGTEHLLLGMLAEPDAVVTRILAKLGAVERIRNDLIAVMDAPDYPTAEPHPMSIADWELRYELLHRRERDQALRMRASKSTGGNEAQSDPHTLRDELCSEDRDNTGWLRTVVRERGWPGRSMVGDDAARAAWLLAQHADQDPEFQRECLGLLERGVKLGEAEAADLAYLTDRVLLAEGRPQRYGTQFTSEQDGCEPRSAPLGGPASRG